MPTYETIRLFNTILNLYYMEELTQSKIAKRLGLSTAKVNRLLQQARELGYVNITITMKRSCSELSTYWRRA